MIRYATYSHIGGRPLNEDSVSVLQKNEHTVCAAVCDGLGGHGGGDRASLFAARILCGEWNGNPEETELKRLFSLAHAAVTSLQTPTKTARTTAVMLTVCGERAAIAHAGDSRLYHFANGRLVRQTRDHSASQIAVMLGDIKESEIRYHVDRARILRCLGQPGPLNTETAGFSLTAGDHAFLLCTDGFWEHVLESEMESCLDGAESPEVWLSRMREMLSRRVTGDHDNNTAAALWLRQET